MTASSTFRTRESITLGEIVELTRSEPVGAVDLERRISGVAPLDLAGPPDVAYYENPRYLDDLRRTKAAACFMKRTQADKAPAGVIVLATRYPYVAFVRVARELFGAALRPASIFRRRGIDAGAFVHPEARLEDDVTIDPGAVIGPGAQIGSGTVIGANAVIGADVCVGRDCSVGPGASVLHALIGDRVIIHPGARVGQDGFGYAPGKNPIKVPQIGRVIIQNDVEIGAGTTIDRGAARDTVVGEGTKIDNLVQVGHNVMIGRNCIIVGQVGIAGSATIGDYVRLGGQVGVADHITIGDGVQVAASSGVMDDIPPGQTWGGTPAREAREALARYRAVEELMVKKLAEPAGKKNEQTG